MAPDRDPVPTERALVALAGLVGYTWLEAHYHGESWTSGCAGVGVDGPVPLGLIDIISRVLMSRMLLFAVSDDLFVPRIGEMKLIEPKGRAVGRATG